MCCSALVCTKAVGFWNTSELIDGVEVWQVSWVSVLVDDNIYMDMHSQRAGDSLDFESDGQRLITTTICGIFNCSRGVLSNIMRFPVR